jgi:hypothetical protein
VRVLDLAWVGVALGLGTIGFGPTMQPARAQGQQEQQEQQLQQQAQNQATEDLNEGAPLQMEDTDPTQLGQLQVQGSVQHERSNGQSQTELQPQIQYGFARNWHLEAAVPLRFGDDKSGSGDIHLGVLRKLNEERGGTPSFALLARAHLPTGRDSEGIATEIKLIAAKTLSIRPGDGGVLRQRLLFNLAYKRNAQAQANERVASTPLCWAIVAR